MILIADSGSTKTSWCVTDGNDFIAYYATDGLNPFFRSTADIVDELRNNLLPKTGANINKIFFYGAGIINPEKGGIVKNALKSLYPQAEIEVQSDLLAAARSTLGKRKGIACILGTGSNSCLYDGEKIVEHVPPLGFILGDEGSGAVLGRKLLGDFLKGVMPKNISAKFGDRFQITYACFLEAVYKKDKPNQFLAQFVPFISDNLSDPYCSKLVEDAFDEFVERNIFMYPGYIEQPICFVGSVAYYFQDQLKKVVEKNQLQVKTVLREPMDGLLKFHTEK
jgi:N-acetylglucosamine kinase-like BadF-type ATPase